MQKSSVEIDASMRVRITSERKNDCSLSNIATIKKCVARYL